MICPSSPRQLLSNQSGPPRIFQRVLARLSNQRTLDDCLSGSRLCVLSKSKLEPAEPPRIQDKDVEEQQVLAMLRSELVESVRFKLCSELDEDDRESPEQVLTLLSTSE